MSSSRPPAHQLQANPALSNLSRSREIMDSEPFVKFYPICHKSNPYSPGFKPNYLGETYKTVDQLATARKELAELRDKVWIECRKLSELLSTSLWAILTTEQ